MESWWKDLRHGLRMLRGAPGFAAVAILSLAIGIGANTAIFSAANALVLRPLPYPDAGRIAILWQRSPGLNVARDWFSLGQYLDIQLENTSFGGVAAAIGASVNLTGDGPPERVDGMRVTSSFFPLFGARTQLGAPFSTDDDQPGRAPSVILNHGFWLRRFGGDRDVVGKTILLNGNSVRVVGVMTNDFSFTKEVMPAVNGIQRIDVILPLPIAASARTKRDGEDFNVFAKLKADESFSRAQREMDIVATRMRERYPANYPATGGLTISVVPLLDEVVGDLRLALYVLLGAVGFVQVIACGNVASLLLSRATARERELAIRTAVGADRARLVRQMLTESILLAMLGGAAGLFVGLAALGALRAFGPTNIPRATEIGVDGWVLAFTFSVSVLTGVACGLVPALRASRVDPSIALKEGGRANVGGGAFGLGRGRLRRLLIAGEVALSLVLLIGATLLLRSYDRITNASPGFDPRNLLSLRLTLPGAKYKADAIPIFFDQLQQRLAALPGVEHVGMNYQLPLSSVAYAWEPIGVEGYVPKTPGSALIISSSAYVSADYFSAMRMPLIGGRAFTAQDIKGAPDVAIVNRNLAARFWPRQSAIGKRLRQGDDGPWRTIVGVIDDNREFETEATPPITTYFPVAQFNIGSRFIVVRTAAGADPAATTTSVLREIHALDPDLPAYDVSTMDDRLRDSLSRRRLATKLLVAFAVIALLLAAVGIYGVTAYWVGERSREIRIRVALGADRTAVLTLLMKEFSLIIGLGIAIGLAAAFALTRVLSSLLFGVSTTDTATFVLLPTVVAAVALLAVLGPARRALRVDPASALSA
ncbi:MAG TPA: ABC transporter permease [Gemmatimonadaceae bacterium]|jgi:predicted permease